MNIRDNVGQILLEFDELILILVILIIVVRSSIISLLTIMRGSERLVERGLGGRGRGGSSGRVGDENLDLRFVQCDLVHQLCDL